MVAGSSEPQARWRSDLLSEAYGGATIAVRDGRVHEANAAARQLYGDACVGRSVDDLFEPADACKLRDLTSKSLTKTVDLSVKHGGVRPSFVLLVKPREYLLVARSSGAQASGAGAAPTGPSSERGGGKSSTRFGREPTAGSASETLSDAVAEIPEGDVSAVLYTIALEARALTNADYVALGIGNDPDRPFRPWVSVGVPHEVAEELQHKPPRPRGLLGVVARGGEVVRITDVRKDQRFRGMPAHHPAMASFLGVPVRFRDRACGNLYLANKPGGREFTEHDELSMITLAASAGIAIETANLYVTERRHRGWLRSVIDQMPHGVLLYDERCRLQAMNQACSSLCSEPSGVDRYGNPVILDLRAPDGRALALDELPMIRAFETEEVTLHEDALLALRNGALIPVSVTAVPVRDAGGRVSGVTTLIEDISERKRLERMRDEWSAIVAHDLRQPISTISLAADMLLKCHAEDFSDCDRRMIERIRRTSAHLGRMIGDLTDASLIESNRVTVVPELTDVGALVQSVVDGVGTSCPDRDLRVSVEGEHEAWVDPGRIRQVLENLVSNASKYGYPDSVIHIAVLGRDDSVEVVVTDHGPGIPPDQLPLLFSRFERSRDAREGKTAGLGLGLYITKGLVEAHGGHIWAESVLGETTSFHVTLPRRPPSKETPRRTDLH